MSSHSRRLTLEGIRAVGSRSEATLTSANNTATLMLSNVKPVANWLDAALNTTYRDLYFSTKRKDVAATDKARARLRALRVKAGLEG